MKIAANAAGGLSACQTGIDRNFEGEGAVNIARPFMVAGVAPSGSNSLAG